MSGLQTAYVGNDNLIWLRGATRARAGTVIDSGVATVTTIEDLDGTELTGVSFPLTMILHDAAAGDWVTQLDDAANLVAGTVYVAVIDIDDGTGVVGHFEAKFLASVRTSS